MSSIRKKKLCYDIVRNINYIKVHGMGVNDSNIKLITVIRIPGGPRTFINTKCIGDGGGGGGGGGGGDDDDDDDDDGDDDDDDDKTTTTARARARARVYVYEYMYVHLHDCACACNLWF